MTTRSFYLSIVSIFLFSCTSTQNQHCVSTVNKLTQVSAKSPTLMSQCDHNNNTRHTFDSEEYCTFENGLFTGEHGKKKADHCTLSQFDEYLHGYNMGFDIFKINKSLATISDELADARHQLWVLNSTKPETVNLSVSEIKTKIAQLERQRAIASSKLYNIRAGLRSTL